MTKDELIGLLNAVQVDAPDSGAVARIMVEREFDRLRADLARVTEERDRLAAALVDAGMTTAESHPIALAALDRRAARIRAEAEADLARVTEERDRLAALSVLDGRAMYAAWRNTESSPHAPEQEAHDLLGARLSDRSTGEALVARIRAEARAEALEEAAAMIEKAYPGTRRMAYVIRALAEKGGEG